MICSGEHHYSQCEVHDKEPERIKCANCALSNLANDKQRKGCMDCIEVKQKLASRSEHQGKFSSPNTFKVREAYFPHLHLVIIVPQT